LEAVVNGLEGSLGNALVHVHLADPQHLFRNLPQRIRNYPLALLPVVPSFDASAVGPCYDRRSSLCPARGTMSNHLTLN
jgi:hypothetical protein